MTEPDQSRFRWPIQSLHRPGCPMREDLEDPRFCQCANMPPDPRTCSLCSELILPEHEFARGTLRDIDGSFAVTHRECSLRMVIGGIGHLEDHGYWCNERHDPDAGMSYRKSAIAVDLWIHKHGIDAATRIEA